MPEPESHGIQPAHMPANSPTQNAADQPGSALATRWTQIRALHGDDAEQAWRWFVGRYRSFIRGVLRTVVGAAAVDLVEHEFWGYVFLSGALRRADEDRRFRPFLAGIVRNFARTHVRDQGLPVAADFAADAVPDRDSQDGELLCWTQNVIANGLRRLHEEHEAAALVLVRFYGLGLDGEPTVPTPASQIADQFGLSRQAVYMLLHRGRRRLRLLVEQELREGCSDEAAFRDELQQLLRVAAKELPGSIEDASGEPSAT